MNIIYLVGFIVVAFYIFKKLTKPTNSDKLTLLQLENWLPIYANATLFEKSNMATALVFQSIVLANTLGVSISADEFMREKNKENIPSIDVVDGWLSFIFDEMAEDMPLSQIQTTPVRTVGALIVVRAHSRIRYRELTRR
jgi:hypothetical protein